MLRVTTPQLQAATAHKPHAPLHVSDLLSLLVLGALWGGSFLLMRIAAPEFGPVPLIEVRLVIATLVLLPILVARERARGRFTDGLAQMTLLGLVNSAIPFVFLAYATLSLTAGFASILNSTAPFFAAIVAFLWLGDRLAPARILGLVIGFGGVLVLVWGRASFKAGGAGLAVLAGLAAAVCYGFAANYTKKYLAGTSPLRTTTVSLATSMVCLAPLTLMYLPGQMPSLGSWLAVIALGILSTGAAYLLYYRLIERVGPARAVAVTFLIPAFGILWGRLFLAEPITTQMLVATPIILTGTALSTGLIPRGGRGRGGAEERGTEGQRE
jgi:drug/metabolite transporter (DMT)-like permease